jgi:hypothetical protein
VKPQARDVPAGAVALAAIAIAFAVYAPALSAPFFSDDLHYVASNAYIHEVSLENALAIWSPFSPVVGIVENYAPVHLTLHALVWQVFGAEVLGHHVVNVLLHALASLLLVGFFRRLGLAQPLALWLGAIFLVHPANIEAVAWVSQLKTTSSMVLMLGALAFQPRRPLAALACFGLALLAKPTAAVALPVALLLQLQQLRSADPEAGPAEWARDESLRWLLAWAGVLALFAAVEFAAFFETAGSTPPVYAELDLRFRTVVAVTLRYLAMALGGLGLAVFHDPPGAASWLDPWFLGGLAWMSFVAWRCAVSLRARTLEVVCWCFVVVSFAPISGWIPLPYAMADRYLYFMLPGLLGALGLSVSGCKRLPVPVPRAVAASSIVFAIMLGVGANRHATLWQSADKLLSHSEERYPDGKVAVLRRARRAALAGDVEACVASLRLAMARGFDRLDTLVSDGAYRALRGRPDFDAIIEELAARLIERGAPGPGASQAGLRVRGQAQFVIGDRASAMRSLELAIELGGPYTSAIEVELEQLKQVGPRR